MAELITLEEAKAYLRLDSTFEDSLVSALLSSAEKLCGDVARLSEEQYVAVFGGSDDQETVYTEAELTKAQGLCRVGSLYALAYMFEHREEADYHELALTLRSILFSLREDRVQ